MLLDTWLVWTVPAPAIGCWSDERFCDRGAFLSLSAKEIGNLPRIGNHRPDLEPVEGTESGGGLGIGRRVETCLHSQGGDRTRSCCVRIAMDPLVLRASLRCGFHADSASLTATPSATGAESTPAFADKVVTDEPFTLTEVAPATLIHWWRILRRGRRIAAMAIATVLILAGIALGVLFARFVRNDGYGVRAANGAPPRSHPADVFESHSFV